LDQPPLTWTSKREEKAQRKNLSDDCADLDSKIDQIIQGLEKSDYKKNLNFKEMLRIRLSEISKRNNAL